MPRRWLAIAVASLLLGALVPTAAAQTDVGEGPAVPADQVEPVAADRSGGLDRGIPSEATDSRSPEQTADAGKIDEALEDASGRVEVVVQLTEEAVAEVAADGASGSQQQSQEQAVEAQQAGFLTEVDRADPQAQELGRVSTALNAVLLEISADALVQLAADVRVESIRRVRNYEMDLTETVPYIGGTAVHGLGFTGVGVEVAVLDSGIDYNHANLGGSGNPADYAANDPIIIEPGTFPTADVIGGFDFVGNQWTGGAGSPLLAPDPDPLDDGPGAGHGTHVADIIGGTNGVAPGAGMYAVKVCSSVSTSCSGVALIQAMDFALDPNGDGDTTDHLDIVNMSLGSLYGQAHDDDLSQAVDNATSVGVLTVAAAGNGADKPYVLDTPGAASSALAVAQTEVPSATLPVINVVGVGPITGAFQAWSAPVTTVITGNVQYGNGNPDPLLGNLNGCAEFAAGSLAGLIVLVDRGACDFSLKIANIANAGGIVGIIGLIAPGAPFSGALGACPLDGCHAIPGFMITQANSSAIKAALPTTATIDPATFVPLVGTMVGSSARGPSMLTNLLKPEIGAPGGSVSAEAGTGTEITPFGGTSGATPMVAGSAALLLEAYPDRGPLELKAVLVNTGNTNIQTDASSPYTGLAPVTRIGGGEVRVDQAVGSPMAAWEAETLSPALSFGFVDASQRFINLTRQVVVRNYTASPLVLNVANEFRGGGANTAARVQVPNRVSVRAFGEATFQVRIRLDSSKLADWTGNSGALGASPVWLTELELDGYINLTDRQSGEQIHLPWHVLPRQSGDVDLRFRRNDVRVRNDGAGTTPVEAYNLIAVSDNLPEGGPGEQSPTPDLRYVGYTTFPDPEGVICAPNSFLWAFAINTWERQAMSVAPALFQIDLDFDGDGVFDHQIFNADLSITGTFNLSDGRNLVFAGPDADGFFNAFFFTDHDTNSGNTLLYVCGEQLGLSLDNAFDPITVVVSAFDIYFGGPGDETGPIGISVLGERYAALFETGGFGSTVLEPGQRDFFEIIDFGPLPDHTDLGLLLLYRGGAATDNEAAVWTP